MIIKTNASRIPERLKIIDEGYYVTFSNSGFSLCHETDGLKDTFDGLDARMLKLADRLRGKFTKENIRKVKEHNAKIEANEELKEENRWKTKEIWRFHDHNPSKEIKEKIRW